MGKTTNKHEDCVACLFSHFLFLTQRTGNLTATESQMIDKMGQTQLIVFDSFYLPFVIVSNTTGMAHFKIKDDSHRIHHSVSDYAIFAWRNSP
jgi:hypothetical protein